MQQNGEVTLEQSKSIPTLKTGSSTCWRAAGIAGAVIGTFLFLFQFNPADSDIFPPCPFHTLTGLHCPGCGSMRAMHQLLHGRLLIAFALNPLMVVSLPFVFYAVLQRYLSVLFERSLPQVYIPARRIWFLLIIIVLFWICRNIPLHPYTLLAP